MRVSDRVQIEKKPEILADTEVAVIKIQDVRIKVLVSVVGNLETVVVASMRVNEDVCYTMSENIGCVLTPSPSLAVS